LKIWGKVINFLQGMVSISKLLEKLKFWPMNWICDQNRGFTMLFVWVLQRNLYKTRLPNSPKTITSYNRKRSLG
jgi:hypothetical protein